MKYVYALIIFILPQIGFVYDINLLGHGIVQAKDTNRLSLSKEEVAWIEQHGTVNVGVKSGWMPIEFRLENESNRGVSLDYLKEITRLTGLKFKLVQNNGDHVDPSKIQMISGVTGKFTSDHFTLSSQPYLIIPYAIYVSQSSKNKYMDVSIEDLTNAKLAIYKHGPLPKKLIKDYPKIDLVFVDIADEAFEYLERNQVDAYIGNELVIDYHIEFHRIKFAKKASVTTYTSEVNMAVRNDEPVLMSILNKAISHIGTNNPNILDYWKSPEPKAHPNHIALLILLILITFAVIFILFKERRKAKLVALDNQQRIWHQANYDAQTELPNRNLYESKILEIIEESAKQETQFALLFIDLDNFKDVNDVSGHSTGDKLLKEVALRLKVNIREEDFVARVGGDEFVIILNRIDDYDFVDVVCKKILNILRLPLRVDHNDYFISATIGVSKYPQHSSKAEELLSFADQAMYEAKRQGRNRFSYFSSGMQESLNKKINLANELRSAINSDQFELVYQPILELKTLKCIKAEALIRWHHPQKGLINPDEFIGIAEETGMIHSLGKWILNQSIKDMVKLRQRLVAKTQMPMICINISPKQFAQPLNLDDFVFELKNNWLSPKDMCFEITEGLLLDASKTVIQAISRLKNEGIKFAIDDFGTGYSALAYLKKFDIDYLKIDKSFIGNLDSNINNRVLCESIISMSHKLKITVSAEGVEYPVQEEILRKNHCDYIQGYLHGKPMALDALIDEYLNNVVVVCDFVKRSKNKKDD